MVNVSRLIDEAEGLASLGLHLEAWEVLESLPASERVRPAVLAVRLLICTGLGKWELGGEIARLIGVDALPYHREAAGGFHLAHAVALCGAGDAPAAREAVRALSVAWPEGRLAALECAGLAEIW